MNAGFTFRLQRNDLSPSVQNLAASLGSGEQRILGVMAQTFKTITDRNFGYTGYKRSSSWKPLSKNYAQRVGRSTATLELSPAEASKVHKSAGAMRKGLHAEMTAGNTARVFIDEAQAPYAARHHFGLDGMPARPIMPIDVTGNLIPQAREEIVASAEGELLRMMKGDSPGGVFFS